MKISGPYNVSVIGAGSWATTYHLPALKFLQDSIPLQLHGIWNRTKEKSEAAAKQFGFKKVYRHLEDLIDDPDIDCFVVLVNPKIIPEIIKKLLVRELPILTEKSPGWTYQEAAELAETVKVVNVVGFNRRYMPLNRKFKQIVDGMDNPYFIECHFYRHDRLCKEFIVETGVHCLNFLEYLLGPVSGIQTDRRRNPLNDTYIWNCEMMFDSGTQGYVKFFPCSGSSIERYEIHSNNMSAYLQSPQTYSSDYPGRIILHENGAVKQIFEGDSEKGTGCNAGFNDEYLDFFNSIKSGDKTISNFKNAASTMAMAEIIEQGSNFSHIEI